MRKIENTGIVLFGYIEIIIGVVTLISLVAAKVLCGIAKPPGVFLFVSLTSLASFILGIGILKYKMWARKLLMFFAAYIVLTKLFIFLGIIKLSPPFEPLIPPAVKNIISLLYHFTVILFLNNERVRYYFDRKGLEK